MRGKEAIKNVFLNIFTSGKYLKTNEIRTTDYFIRYVLMNFTFLATFALFLYSGIASIIYGMGRETGVYFFLAALVLVFAAIARTNIRQINSGTMALVSFALCNGVIIHFNHQYGIALVSVFPLLAVVILGLKRGAKAALVLFLYLLGMYIYMPAERAPVLHASFMPLSVVYFSILIIACVIERTRIIKDKIIEGQRLDLENFNKNLQELVEEKTKKVVTLQNAVLKTMSDLVEFRDHNTGEHTERTQNWVMMLLLEIKAHGLFAETIKGWDLNLVLESVQLHDVGKIAISDSILKKPGPLTKEEYDEMKKHADYGASIIEGIEKKAGESEFLNHAKIFAHTHHEKWDGSGYPKGLKGEEIPLQGRIMAIADVYDALISERPYKKALPHDEAVSIIIKGKGTQFDPVLTDFFAKTYGKI